MQGWICIQSYPDVPQASVAKAYLESEGLAAVVVPKQSSAYPGFFGSHAQLWVADPDAPAAYLLLNREAGDASSSHTLPTPSHD